MTSSSAKFADQLRGAREAQGMSQADLAARAKFEPSAISHFESGRRAPSFENLRRLADALNVSTDSLLGRGEQTAPTDATVQKLFRYAEQATPHDRELLAEFARAMVEKHKQRTKK